MTCPTARWTRGPLPSRFNLLGLCFVDISCRDFLVISVLVLFCPSLGEPSQCWVCGHSLQGLGTSIVEGFGQSQARGHPGAHHWGPQLRTHSLLEMLNQPASFQRDLESYPRRLLGLERVSRAPEPLLPARTAETLPRVDELASPGPATQHEQSGPPPSMAILKAEELLQEGSSPDPTAAHLCPEPWGFCFWSSCPQPRKPRRPGGHTAIVFPPHAPREQGQCRQVAPEQGPEARTLGLLPLAPASATPQATQKTRQ